MLEKRPADGFDFDEDPFTMDSDFSDSEEEEEEDVVMMIPESPEYSSCNTMSQKTLPIPKCDLQDEEKNGFQLIRENENFIIKGFPLENSCSDMSFIEYKMVFERKQDA